MYYLRKLLHVVFVLGYLVGVFLFCYYTFQMDTGQPLGEIINQVKAPVDRRQMELEACRQNVKRTEQNFLLMGSAENWKIWSKAEQRCRELEALAIP